MFADSQRVVDVDDRDVCMCLTATGAHSGEFTLWNGLTFNFETILQAHDSPIRSMWYGYGALTFTATRYS